MKSLRELFETPRRAPQERFSQEAEFEPDIQQTVGELLVPAPLSPVPISVPTPRESPPKSHRTFFTVGATSSASVTPADKARIMVEFGINSIKISNLSSQWVYLADVDEFVPPQVWNAVIRGNGGSVLDCRFETPPGLAAGNIQSTLERVMLMVTQEIIPLTPGVVFRTIPTT